MSEKELKHVIALLLEDAKRLQQMEPNAGTEARIWFAKKNLSEESATDSSQQGFVEGVGTADDLLLAPCPDSDVTMNISIRERLAIARVQLHMIESELE